MIDKLVLRCWFISNDVNISDLNLPLQGTFDPVTKEVADLWHKWDSIPTDFASIAFKFFDVHEKRPDPYLEISGNPAKLMNGHNLWGSDDLGVCAMALLDEFNKVHPDILLMLQLEHTQVVLVDLTFHSWAESDYAAERFISSLANVSNGQTRARHSIASTVYFGKKDSKYKRLKVYLKSNELVHQSKSFLKRSPDLHPQIYTERLHAFATGMIRWEATLKTDWFTTRSFSVLLFDLIKVFDARSFWYQAWQDVFNAIGSGDEIMVTKINDDVDVLEKLRALYTSPRGSTSKADSVYRTFRFIKSDGYENAVLLGNRMTIWRHVKALESIGISKAALQQYRGEGLGHEVIPLVRYLHVDFSAQVPDWAQIAA